MAMPNYVIIAILLSMPNYVIIAILLHFVVTEWLICVDLEIFIMPIGIRFVVYYNFHHILTRIYV